MRHQRLRPGAKTPHLIVLSVLSVFAFLWVHRRGISPSSPTAKDECLVSHGKYKGSVYESHNNRGGSGETISNKCLVESPWMRLAQHSVKLSSGDHTIIDDWLWIDYHDRINVLVEDPQTPGSFLILQQTKYALDSQISLAVVGGIIEPQKSRSEREKSSQSKTESPLLAAQREVNEELHVTCQSWKALGKFRTDVNRGMGWVHPYLARDCAYSAGGNDENLIQDETAVGAHDTEQQSIRSMAKSDVRTAVMDGKFLEVQWSNTVALAMLYLAEDYNNN